MSAGGLLSHTGKQKEASVEGAEYQITRELHSIFY